MKRQRKKGLAAVTASSLGGADYLSKLPDEILQVILSLLPAKEAARTSVLAQGWRDHWKFTRRLRITGTATPASVQEVRSFVDYLLHLRLHALERAPLDACEITIGDFDDNDLLRDLEIWIRRAVECKVKELKVDMYRHGQEDPGFLVSDEPLVSPHLTRLELYGIDFSQGFLDLSSCRALQDLDIGVCDFACVRKMESPSLKRLSISHCTSGHLSRFRISAPCLVSLRLDHPSWNRTPVLESMPELVVAYVKINTLEDYCSCDDPMDCYHVMGNSSYSDSDDSEEGSDDADNHVMKSVLLGGLSETTNLTLKSDCSMYIFRRDLRWCPTFSKLKTLLLNEYWCVPADCCALACILEHSPVLEKLTLSLYCRDVFSSKEAKHELEMKGRLDETERSAKISAYLKVVEVKCGVRNSIVLNIINFLGTRNIWFNEE